MLPVRLNQPMDRYLESGVKFFSLVGSGALPQPPKTASSGSVERLFSASGALMRAHRNRLSPTTVEALLLAKETQFFDQKPLD
jgi:hypothetical protein